MNRRPSTHPVRLLPGDNPFGVDPELDLLHPVPAEGRLWSETMFFHIWAPESGVGVFVHVGRWPAEPDLWWAQVVVMLPDGLLLVDCFWGRALDRRGPATGNLRVACDEPLRRWRIWFDGAGESTDLAGMHRGPRGAGPARAVRFEAELEATAPVWDMPRALGRDTSRLEGPSWASFHHTQGFRATGRLDSEGDAWSLQGVAHRDYSSGRRDIEPLGGLHFFGLVFPEAGRVVNGLVNW